LTYHDAVRTTIDLDEDLIARAKERAARHRTTLSGIVREAVQLYLSCEASEGEVAPFVLVTAGRPGGTYPSPRRVAALLDEEERGEER
jgi:hypothetical protein